MAQLQNSDSTHTRTIKDLSKRVVDQTPVKDSLFELAEAYFNDQAENEEKLRFADDQVKEAERELEECDNSERKLTLSEKLNKLKVVRSDLVKSLDDVRLERYDKAHKLASDIMQELQGRSTEEFNNNVARFLGTLQLMSPTEGKGIAKANQKTKHLYKAVVTIRLLHHLLDDGWLRNSYIKSVLQQQEAFLEKYSEKELPDSPFRQGVEIPVILAALSQDIGQLHPDAKKILFGEDGNLDEFRMLEKDDRNELLKINYTQSLKFVTHGLGMDKYKGNSKEERDTFQEAQKEQLQFIRELMKAAVNPGDGIGNLLKVPQVYASVIMSTKSNYSYETLPRVSAVMEKGAEVGAYDKEVSDALISMLGWFPQGFGVTYIPKDSDGRDADRYEFAIVNTLYPQAPDVPICRVATRGLQFSTFSLNHAIGKQNNLYYANTRRKLERVSKDRLEEILRELSSNFEERKDMELIPKCWHPQDFFSSSKKQNLWNKGETYRI
ncbi:MAG: hypothetical protein ACFHVJ_06920 [Aestuariibacter sp.]